MGGTTTGGTSLWEDDPPRWKDMDIPTVTYEAWSQKSEQEQREAIRARLLELVPLVYETPFWPKVGWRFKRERRRNTKFTRIGLALAIPAVLLAVVLPVSNERKCLLVLAGALLVHVGDVVDTIISGEYRFLRMLRWSGRSNTLDTERRRNPIEFWAVTTVGILIALGGFVLVTWEFFR